MQQKKMLRNKESGKELKMTKFEVVRSITGVTEFSNLIFHLAMEAGSPEALKENLSKNLSGDEMQIIKLAARSKDYPLSLDGLQ